MHPAGKNTAGHIRRLRLFVTALAAACMLGGLLRPAPAAADPRPNILIIVGDDVGYADVGFHGCQDIPTPSLDALAAAGTRFTAGYVSCPVCSPTRAGLLTGRYQNRFGHEFNPGKPDYGLPATETTLADRLRAAGYATGLVGKWHLGSRPDMIPGQRGFDEFFGFLDGAHGYFDPRGILRGQEGVAEIDYTTDAFAREACDFIDRHRGRPWFLYLAFNAVHTPMEATPERLERFAKIADARRRTYAAMMAAMDEAIGSVRERLVATGQAHNTLVAFVSDNGGPTLQGTTINGASNAPLRGSKRTTLEGGIRVPYLLSWPGHVRVGVFNEPVLQFDITATALAAAGVKAGESWNLDGVDLLPHLAGSNAAPPHDVLCWRYGGQMAIRAGDWKLVRYAVNADADPDRVWKEVTAARLYNLATDVGESQDLAASMPSKVDDLQARWDAWNQANRAPNPGGDGREIR